jgi:hypothetical protein
MDPVPKILKPLVQEWNREGYIVSFKVRLQALSFSPFMPANLRLASKDDDKPFAILSLPHSFYLYRSSEPGPCPVLFPVSTA